MEHGQLITGGFKNALQLPGVNLCIIRTRQSEQWVKLVLDYQFSLNLANILHYSNHLREGYSELGLCTTGESPD